MSSNSPDVPQQSSPETARRAMADFLANMSHEIRTPLNAIIGMAYLVQQSELEPRQREYLGKIEAAGQHLLGIVTEMLDYTRLEAGEIILARVEFDPAALLEETVRKHANVALAKRLRIIATVKPSVPTWLVGDPVRLGQLIGHYLANAVKFTERGQIEIVLSGESGVSDTNSTCRLHGSVRDTGIGLTEEQRKGLFQAFRQADASTTRKFGGTGLGLAIARKLSELMNGDVGLNSVPGEGSCFQFRVVLGIAPEASLRSESYSIVIEPGALAETSATGSPEDRARLVEVRTRLQVLLADDDAEATEVLADNADLLRILLPEYYLPLEKAIQNFDFALALSVLKQAQNTDPSPVLA